MNSAQPPKEEGGLGGVQGGPLDDKEKTAAVDDWTKTTCTYLKVGTNEGMNGWMEYLNIYKMHIHLHTITTCYATTATSYSIYIHTLLLAACHPRR